jgi:hypothetical protein
MRHAPFVILALLPLLLLLLALPLGAQAIITDDGELSVSSNAATGVGRSST